jgi:hypothetical protein
VRWFDDLRAGLPAEVAPTQLVEVFGKPAVDDAAMLPVYLRLRIPRDAVPGDYRGTVSVQVAGAASVSVPVEVSVSGYVLPDPKDFRTYVGLYQSPTSVAMQYKVKEWSEEHWKLLEPSFALLARAGNKMVNIPIVEQTQFGNDEGLVYWVRQADAPADQPPQPVEAFEYDFTVFDRFLALAQKHFGPMDYVALQIWHSGGWEARKADQQNTVTVVDPRTGKRTSMQVPAFDTAESKAFWKPLLAACQERLAKRNLDKAMCIGILSDGTAPKEVFAAFDEIWPGPAAAEPASGPAKTGGAPARWTRGLHNPCGFGGPYKFDGGGVCVLHEHCYGSPLFRLNEPITGLWTYRGKPGTAYVRIADFEARATLLAYRTLSDQSILQRKQGLGRIGFDFWPVLEAGRSRTVIYNRYPFSSCAQRAPALYTFSWPGPAGAETTQRFEVFCQGIQESETLLAVSQALDHRGDKMDPALAGRCRQLLTDRLWFATDRTMFSDWQGTVYHVNHHGWQELIGRSYDCAAAVTAP